MSPKGYGSDRSGGVGTHGTDASDSGYGFNYTPNIEVSDPIFQWPDGSWRDQNGNPVDPPPGDNGGFTGP